MKKLLSILILLLALLWMSLDYNVFSILEMRPQSLHQWRQTDCLSFTENYYSFKAKFLEPQVHNLSSNEGRAAGEFPIIYYLNAKLWSLFGKSELLSRLFTALIALVGFFALFKLGKQLTGSSLQASIAPLVLFSSALFPYYAFNFLPNIVSLSLAFVSLYCIYNWYKHERLSMLFLAFVFCSLAGLIKASSLIGPFAGFAAIGLLSLKPFSKRAVYSFLAVLFCLLMMFIWYSYAAQYNLNHASNSFIIGYVPIWEMSKAEIASVIDGFNQNWRNHFYSELAYFIFFGLSILNCLLLVIRAKWKFLIFYFLCLLGLLLYLLLFFRNLGIHDYYLIELYLFPALLVVTFFHAIRNWNYAWLAPLALIGFCIFILTETRKAQGKLKERFNSYYNHQHLTYFQVLEDIESDLQELGIDKNAKVISIPDESPNISLYLMNRKGWTSYGNQNLDSEGIAHSIALGAQFLIVNEPEMVNEDYLKAYTQELLLEKGNLRIYKL